jgi:phenylalanyl-tRNA synthetase beta chain
VCTVDDTGGLIMLKNKQIGTINNKDGILELDLDAVIAEIPGGVYESIESKKNEKKYEKVSEFPFSARDVAVFIPGEKGREGEILDVIKREGGNLIVRIDLFDVFEKKNKETGEIEKTSYAFRIVFQSFEKTLTDDEINPIMERIYTLLKDKGFEIR